MRDHHRQRVSVIAQGEDIELMAGKTARVSTSAKAVSTWNNAPQLLIRENKRLRYFVVIVVSLLPVVDTRG